MPDAIRARRVPQRTPGSARIGTLAMALPGALLCLLLVSCGGRAPQGDASSVPSLSASRSAPTAPVKPRTSR